MDPQTMLIIGFMGVGFLFVLLALGLHIGAALLTVGIIGVTVLKGLGTAGNLAVTTSFHFTVMYVCTILPLFITMGIVGGAGGIAEDAFKASYVWTGGMRSGVPIATLVANAFFGAVTGSSIVSAIIFSKLASPKMRKLGFSVGFSYGLTTTAGIIGMLIPPSAVAVIYGMLTGEPTGKLLMAGIGPGLVLTFTLGLTSIIMVRMHPTWGAEEAEKMKGVRVTWRDRMRTTSLLWPILVIGLIVIIGIYAGVFNPTEAAAVATFVVIGISLALRRITFRQTGGLLKEAMSTIGMILLMFIGAQAFGRFLALSGITFLMTDAVISMGLTPLGFTLAVIPLFLVLGCFLDSASMLTLCMPILYPISNVIGVQPMWFATVVIFAVEIGLVTPPVGLNIFGVKGIAEPDVSLEAIFKGCLPFYGALIATMCVLLLWPPLAAWLPAQMMR